MRSRSTSTAVLALSPDDESHLADSNSTRAPQPVAVARRTLTSRTKGISRFSRSRANRHAWSLEMAILCDQKLGGSGLIVITITGCSFATASATPSNSTS